MKTKLLITLLAIMAGLSGALAQNNSTADKIIGTYWSPKKDAKIEIYKKGTRYYGRTVWLAAPKIDSKNPDARLRQRNMLGVDLLTDFSYDDGEYSGGEIYDPENGKTYSCKISFKGKDLKVRGYIGISLFGRTEIFQHT